jgi:hypothetical protein
MTLLGLEINAATVGAFYARQEEDLHALLRGMETENPSALRFAAANLYADLRMRDFFPAKAREILQRRIKEVEKAKLNIDLGGSTVMGVSGKVEYMYLQVTPELELRVETSTVPFLTGFLDRLPVAQDGLLYRIIATAIPPMISFLPGDLIGELKKFDPSLYVRVAQSQIDAVETQLRAANCAHVELRDTPLVNQYRH